MIITEDVIVETIVKNVVGIQCNKCGGIFEPSCADTTQQFNTSIGYTSKYPSSFKFDLCEECLTSIIKEFLVVPENFMNQSAYTPAFITDHNLHQSLFDEWKITNEWTFDDNPYKNDIDESYQEDSTYEEYYEEFENIQTCKPARTNHLKIIK